MDSCLCRLQWPPNQSCKNRSYCALFGGPALLFACDDCTEASGARSLTLSQLQLTKNTCSNAVPVAVVCMERSRVLRRGLQGDQLTKVCRSIWGAHFCSIYRTIRHSEHYSACQDFIHPCDNIGCHLSFLPAAERLVREVG